MRRSIRRATLVLAATVALVCAAAAPLAAQVRIEADNLAATRHKIVVSGSIDLTTLVAFSQAVGDPRISATPSPFVELNSLGGSVSAAMAIGTLIRNGRFDTGVDRQHECYSACVLILAAGVRRGTVSGRVGIHSPRMVFAAGRSRAEVKAIHDRMADSVGDYLRGMGIPNGLLPAMLAVPSDDLRILGPVEMQALGLLDALPHPRERPALGQAGQRKVAHVPRTKANPRREKQLALDRGPWGQHRPARKIALALPPGLWPAAATNGRIGRAATTRLPPQHSVIARKTGGSPRHARTGLRLSHSSSQGAFAARST